MTKPRTHLLYFTVALAFLALDLWSKHAAFARIPPGGAYVVWEGVFELNPIRNPGMMWGGFQDVPAHWWVVLRGSVLIGLVWLYFSLGNRAWIVQVAFGLVTAGAMGNIYDNVFGGVPLGLGYFAGAVRDFLRITLFRFPTFNVADSCICVGAPLLLIILWNHDRRRVPSPRPSEGIAG